MTLEFIVNHLWQSTLFTLLTTGVAFMLRGYSPKVRYWIWLSASLKFLLPWFVLVSLGSMVPLGSYQDLPGRTSTFPSTLIEMAEPFSLGLGATAPAEPQIRWGIASLALLWGAGFIALALTKYLRWNGLRAMLRSGTQVKLPITVPTVIVPNAPEPGIVGILNPVLVLPTLFLERLNTEQLHAVLAHELAHVRRRDNLFATIHMVVEAVFWFHPLVWWIGSRMLEERELACDEEVLRLGHAPTDYVRGILTVCEHYSEAPLPCVSGVAGANVKKRLNKILCGSFAHELNRHWKLALAFGAATAVVLPVGLGVWIAPQANAQSTNSEEIPELFEVVSVKVHPEPIEFRDDQIHGMNYHVVGLPLINLIMDAYRMSGRQIFGGPNWVRSGVYFDVEAKASESAPLTWDRLRPMLQAMLADRFQLKVRRGAQEMPCYDLVIAKGGVKMKENTDPGPPGGVANGTDAKGVHVRAESGTIARLATNLLADRLIVDKTGLTGKYRIELDYATINTPDANVPSLYAAIEEQLGLKLVPSRTKLETLEILSVEKPSGN